MNHPSSSSSRFGFSDEVELPAQIRDTVEQKMTQKELATSPNAKTIVIGCQGSSGLPLVLGSDLTK